MIRKNVAGQGAYLYAHDKVTDLPKTGDSANVSGFVTLDGAPESALASGITEIDATNMPGVYWQPLAQGETNGAAIALGWKSVTANVTIEPQMILTEPAPGSAGGTASYEQAVAIKAKTDGLSVGDVVTILSPFNPTTGKLILVRGDDYRAGVPGTLPPFTSSSWPNLTGATVRMTVRLLPSPTAGEEDDSLLTLTDTTASRIAGAGLQSVTFEPLARPGNPILNNQVGGTHYLVPGRNRAKWDIQATLADGTIRTLAVGLMDVTEDQTRDVAP